PVQPEIPRTAEYIKQALARVGIDVELRNIDLATFIRQVYNWEFELTQNYLYLLPAPTLGVQRLYISGNIKKGTPFAHAAGYEHKDVDAAFTAAQTENDQAKRKELFVRAQRQIQEDLPALNLLELSFVTLHNSKLMNHTMGADGPYGGFRDTSSQPQPAGAARFLVAVMLARPGVARFLARRLAQAVPTVLLIIVVNFLVLHLTPGDIVDVLAGEAGAATPEYVAMLRQRFGLDRPLAAQLASYVWGVVNLDLGFSF